MKTSNTLWWAMLLVVLWNPILVSALSPGYHLAARPKTSSLCMKSYEIGLALAGGGNRASSTCIGFLRGFQQKKIKQKDGSTCSAMDLVKYNSGISGGSVPALLYSFAQVPTQDLLETNRTVEPEQITSELLENLPKTSMGYPITTNPLRMPTLDRIPFVLSRLTKIHSYWSGIVYRNFLKPVNVPQDKLFAANEQDVENIVKENPNLRKRDFIYPRPDTKALPMLLYTLRGTRADFNRFMKESRAAIAEAWNAYKMEESLLSISSDNKKSDRPSLTEKLLEARDNHGGALPVPFTVTPSVVRTMYEGTMKLRNTEFTFPVQDSKPYAWGTRSRFSVEAALAMSTNFLGLFAHVGTLLTNVRRIDDVTQAFADGGLSDLCGILPLVQRKVKKIICIFNFNQNPPYSDFSTRYSDFYNAAPCTSVNDPDFEEKFRRWLKMLDPRISCYFGFFGGERIDSTVLDHVFHDPDLDRLKELMVKYNSLYKAGEPLIATLHDLKVLENPFWGTVAGETVDLTFVYMNMPKKFSNRVPIDAAPPPEGTSKIDDNGQFNNEEMRAVPELPWNPPKEGLQYTNQQVNMISYLGSWMVHHAWEPLLGHDGKVQFKGFQEIFESDRVPNTV